MPETGMGYHVVSILTRDGRRYDGVRIVGGTVASIEGRSEIPFTEDDIQDIVASRGR